MTTVLGRVVIVCCVLLVSSPLALYGLVDVGVLFVTHLVVFVVAALFICVFRKYTFSPPKKFPHDIKTQSGLMALLNMRVVKATRCERPLEGLNIKCGPLKHSGVVVTLTDGSTWLIHKGGQYGTPSGGQTVVTDNIHMTSKWTPLYSTTKKVYSSRVTDYVKAGGKEYHGLWDNCHYAANRMMKLP